MNIDALHLSQVLIVGTFWFWVLLLAAYIGMMVCCEFFEKGFLAFLIFIATIVVLQLFSDANILGIIIRNPLWLLAGFIVYVLTGTAYSFPKWWSFVRDNRHRYNEFKQDFLERNGIKGKDISIPNELLQRFQQDLLYSGIFVRPQVRDHKARILSWMTYWPVSLVFTILNDPVRRIFRHMFYMLKEYYQKISDNAWVDVEDDFKKPIVAPTERTPT